MPNQDLIDYCNEEKQIHETEIESLRQTITSLDEGIEQFKVNIEQFNKQKEDVESNISNLEEGNAKLNQIISILEAQ